VSRFVSASSNELQHPTLDVDNPYAQITLPVLLKGRDIVDRVLPPK
jgi:hypothetical protein